MVKVAEDLGILLDEGLKQTVDQYTERIVAERNLRKQRDLYSESISACDQTKVDKLQALIDIASEKSVEK